jgi:DNA-binding GntR family transcriptional regulator
MNLPIWVIVPSSSNEICKGSPFSLSAVREALSRLTSEGLVVAELQRGFRAAPISEDELRDLTWVRIEIEGICLRRAIAAGDLAWESGIVAAYHRLSRTPERATGDENRLEDEWSLAHAAFHEALVKACPSAWLLRLRGTLYAQAERYRRLSIPLSNRRRDLDSEHRGIVQTVLARNPDEACTLMAAHLNRTTRILLERLAKRDETDRQPNCIASDVP